MKKNSIMRSAIAFILVLSMVFTMGMPAYASAAEEVVKYVSLGASNINGYGMNGYRMNEGTENEVNVYGYKQIVDKAYPAIFAKALGEKMGKTVDITQLGISSFRAEEIHVMLDDEYMGDEYTDWRFHDGGQEWFKAAAVADGVYEGTALDHLRDEYQKAIAEADVVSMDIGMNNFGVFVCQRTFDYLQGDEPSFSADLSLYSEEWDEHVDELRAMREEIKTLLGGYDLAGSDDALVKYLVETIQYAYLGFITHFDASMAHIYKMNPDVDVVIVGMYNTMADVMLEYSADVIIPAGDVVDIVLKYANAHMEKESVYSDCYTYVDSSARHNFYHQLSKDGKNYETMSDECHRVISEYSRPIAQGALESNSMLGMMVDEDGLTDFIADVFVQIFTKALSNPVLNMEALGSMDTDAFEDAVTECITDAVTRNYTPGETYNGPDLTFLDEEPNATIGFFWCRFFYEDWFFIHPDEQGHSEAAAQIAEAYEETFINGDKDDEIQKALCATGEHNYGEAVITQPTCTEAGKSTRTCEACGFVEEEVTDEAAGHDFDETVVKATTKKNGKIEKVCKTCGEMESQVIYYPKTIKLSKTSFVYNNKVQKPTVTVTDSNGKKLKNNTDYSVKFVNAKKAVGQYTVKITFKGNYSGTVNKSYKIVPKGTTISKLTNAKKAITVKWKKQATQTTGYEIQMATDKTFTKNKKLTTVAKTATISKKVTGLKANTKYFVRVRTYKNVKINNKTTKIYSAWSATKTVKTK